MSSSSSSGRPVVVGRVDEPPRRVIVNEYGEYDPAPSYQYEDRYDYYGNRRTVRVYSNRRPCRYVVEERPAYYYNDPYYDNDAALFICLYCWCLFIIFLLIVSTSASGAYKAQSFSDGWGKITLWAYDEFTYAKQYFQRR